MLVSVVIPAYNEEQFLPRTLESINNLSHEKFDVEIVVIDGSSTDKTVDIAKHYEARVISIPHDGIGSARQEGIRQAKGDVVAFTDADTIVPKDWLLKHLEVLIKSGVAATFGPYKVDQSGGFRPYSFLINNRYVLIKFLPAFLRVLYLPGQNFVFWRQKAIEIGGFDVKLRVMEDVDLGLRLRGKGKVTYVPVMVRSSGRRGKEGLGFFVRGIKTAFDYFFLSKKSELQTFPDYR